MTKDYWKQENRGGKDKKRKSIEFEASMGRGIHEGEDEASPGKVQVDSREKEVRPHISVWHELWKKEVSYSFWGKW